MKKIIIVTVGEPEEGQGVFSRGLSNNGKNQINEVLISDEWEQLKKIETVFIGKGTHYQETAEILNLYIPPSYETIICGGLELRTEAIEELIESFEENTLLIIDPNFISTSISNGVLLEIDFDPEKGFTWPLKEGEDYNILFSGITSFRQI